MNLVLNSATILRFGILGPFFLVGLVSSKAKLLIQLTGAVLYMILAALHHVDSNAPTAIPAGTKSWDAETGMIPFVQSTKY